LTRYLHLLSVPTRRSSDLTEGIPVNGRQGVVQEMRVDLGLKGLHFVFLLLDPAFVNVLDQLFGIPDHPVQHNGKVADFILVFLRKGHGEIIPNSFLQGSVNGPDTACEAPCKTVDGNQQEEEGGEYAAENNEERTAVQPALDVKLQGPGPVHNLSGPAAGSGPVREGRLFDGSPPQGDAVRQG